MLLNEMYLVVKRKSRERNFLSKICFAYVGDANFASKNVFFIFKSSIASGKTWRKSSKASRHRSGHVLWKRRVVGPGGGSVHGGGGSQVGRRGHGGGSPPPTPRARRSRPEGVPWSGRFTLRTPVVVVPDSPHANGAIIGSGEDMTVVDVDGVDGRVVSFHLPDEGARFDGPKLQRAGPATADDRLRSG